MKDFDSVIRGRLVTPEAVLENGWLGISQGRIQAIGQGPSPQATNVHDAGQDWVLPGIIDGQTHAGSCRGLVGLESTTRSAIAGGVTTLVDMPYDNPDPLSTLERLDAKVKAIESMSYCDVALYGTITTGQDPRIIEDLAREGVCALKISAYEVHPSRFPRISNAETLDLLEVAAGVGLPVGLHNEDQEIVHSRIARIKAQGLGGFAQHSPSRPPAAELTSTASFLELGAATGAHVHIVHISLPRGYQLVDQYRQDGHRATAEACMHYLSFDAAIHGSSKGARLKVNPPIREGVLDGLWGALDRGSVEFVSSDHSSWPLGNKNSLSIFDAGAGIPGLETLVPAFYTALRQRNSQPMQTLARFMAEQPAKFFGLWPQKGALMVGADADVTIMRDHEWVYDSSKAHDELNWTPYDGEVFQGQIAATFLRGVQVWDGQNILGRPGMGRYAHHLQSARAQRSKASHA
jgi:allantoinase